MSKFEVRYQTNSSPSIYFGGFEFWGMLNCWPLVAKNNHLPNVNKLGILYCLKLNVPTRRSRNQKLNETWRQAGWKLSSKTCSLFGREIPTRRSRSQEVNGMRRQAGWKLSSKTCSLFGREILKTAYSPTAFDGATTINLTAGCTSAMRVLVAETVRNGQPLKAVRRQRPQARAMILFFIVLPFSFSSETGRAKPTWPICDYLERMKNRPQDEIA